MIVLLFQGHILCLGGCRQLDATGLKITMICQSNNTIFSTNTSLYAVFQTLPFALSARHIWF